MAGTTVTLDQDTGEQAALKLTVNGGTPIGVATASATPFTVAGIESDDNGTVSFSDGSHAPVVVNIVNGVLAATTANLAGLNDGPITATLHLNNDASGNSFTNVVTTATLDQDTGEQAALKLTVTTTAISAATAPAVPFTVAGLDSEDTGIVTFTDVNNMTVKVNVKGGQTSYTANLASLADGTITSSLAVNTDTAGNTFTPVAGTKLTLTQLDHWINASGGNWATASNWTTWSGTHAVPTATIEPLAKLSGRAAARHVGDMV